jgi:hypothetical protein
MAENRVVVGVFFERAFAEHALLDLRANGFSDEQIGFLVRDPEVGTPTEKLEAMAPGSEMDRGAATGAMTGGVLGGVVGAAAALLIPGLGPAIVGGILTTILGGMAFGAAAGGLLGAFVHIGISEEQAHYYTQEFQQGRTIIIVQADEYPQIAFDILKHNRAYNAENPDPASLPQEVDTSGATSKLDEVS